MQNQVKKGICAGLCLVLAFVLWTVLILRVDVQPLGQNGTDIGFASLNVRFHALTGVHMAVYTLTDWLEAVPLLVCAGFGVLGAMQLLKRKSLKKVDRDIVLLSVYYILVICAFLFFEAAALNYRPVLIEGKLEASYPSSTTLLVLSVMPTLKFQADRRAKNPALKRVTGVFVLLFSAFMVIGRLISGVHWLTDIIGSLLLSLGLYLLYKNTVSLLEQR